MKNKIIGGLLLSTPFMALSTAIGADKGWVTGLLVYCMLCFVVTSVVTGMYMLTKY